MIDERETMARLRCGDPSALKAIYEEYKDDLFTIARCLLRDVSTAEDCLHDVFVNFAAGGASTLRLRKSLKGYLAGSVANRARDLLRRKSKEVVGLEQAPEDPSIAGEPGRRLIAEDEMERVNEALSTLPFEQREVMTLRLHGELKFKEIARRLNLSINTVQSRYRYGLDRVRVLLNAGART